MQEGEEGVDIAKFQFQDKLFDVEVLIAILYRCINKEIDETKLYLFVWGG